MTGSAFAVGGNKMKQYIALAINDGMTITSNPKKSPLEAEGALRLQHVVLEVQTSEGKIVAVNQMKTQ